MNSKTVIIIAGPTAVGKTALAIDIARHFNTEIISADSRQCFTELNIGVAKPSPQQLESVKHYFINTHSIHEEVNAAVFEKYALQSVSEIFRKQDVAVMTGGTGLYIKAFCEGIDIIPAIPPEVRSEVRLQYEQSGIEWLQKEIKEKDPIYYNSGEILNPQRLMRALEVKLTTGRSIREFQKQNKIKRDFTIVKAGLELSKEELHRNIHHRTDEMMNAGLLNEVHTLNSCRHINALQTVGYAELFEYLDGNISLEDAVALIKKNTRHYAKRQLTWFKKDPDIKWFSPADHNKIIDWCVSQLL